MAEGRSLLRGLCLNRCGTAVLNIFDRQLDVDLIFDTTISAGDDSFSRGVLREAADCGLVDGRLPSSEAKVGIEPDASAQEKYFRRCDD